jgi:hypothetical protein
MQHPREAIGKHIQAITRQHKAEHHVRILLFVLQRVGDVEVDEVKQRDGAHEQQELAGARGG